MTKQTSSIIVETTCVHAIPKYRSLKTRTPQGTENITNAQEVLAAPRVKTIDGSLRHRSPGFRTMKHGNCRKEFLQKIISTVDGQPVLPRTKRKPSTARRRWCFGSSHWEKMVGYRLVRYINMKAVYERLRVETGASEAVRSYSND